MKNNCFRLKFFHNIRYCFFENIFKALDYYLDVKDDVEDASKNAKIELHGNVVYIGHKDALKIETFSENMNEYDEDMNFPDDDDLNDDYYDDNIDEYCVLVFDKAGNAGNGIRTT